MDYQQRVFVLTVGLMVLEFSPVWAEPGFDEKYERDYNIFNPINEFRLNNPLNPINSVDPQTPFNPINRFDPRNPANPINRYNPNNPLNPINRYNPNIPFQPLDAFPGRRSDSVTMTRSIPAHCAGLQADGFPLLPREHGYL